MDTVRRVERTQAERHTIFRTFLIADIRGYTTFTRTRGDAAAGRLAGTFADLARDAVCARNGSVIELRGDEALAVFEDPAQAVRAAIELQQLCGEQSVRDPGPASDWASRSRPAASSHRPRVS
jgi:class 3 adenylate cyclase